MLVILTEWNEYRALDLAVVSEAMRGRCLLDLRNVFNPADAAKAGLVYRSIGRPAEDAAAAAEIEKKVAANEKKASAKKTRKKRVSKKPTE